MQPSCTHKRSGTTAYIPRIIHTVQRTAICSSWRVAKACWDALPHKCQLTAKTIACLSGVPHRAASRNLQQLARREGVLRTRLGVRSGASQQVAHRWWQRSFQRLGCIQTQNRWVCGHIELHDLTSVCAAAAASVAHRRRQRSLQRLACAARKVGGTSSIRAQAIYAGAHLSGNFGNGGRAGSQPR